MFIVKASCWSSTYKWNFNTCHCSLTPLFSTHEFCSLDSSEFPQTSRPLTIGGDLEYQPTKHLYIQVLSKYSLNMKGLPRKPYWPAIDRKYPKRLTIKDFATRSGWLGIKDDNQLTLSSQQRGGLQKLIKPPSPSPNIYSCYTTPSHRKLWCAWMRQWFMLQQELQCHCWGPRFLIALSHRCSGLSKSMHSQRECLFHDSKYQIITA